MARTRWTWCTILRQHERIIGLFAYANVGDWWARPLAAGVVYPGVSGNDPTYRPLMRYMRSIGVRDSRSLTRAQIEAAPEAARKVLQSFEEEG